MNRTWKQANGRSWLLATPARCALAFATLVMVDGACAISVFNTGVDASGSKLAVGSVDPHWQLIAGPGVSTPTSAFVVNNQHPSGQYFSTADSNWIWGNANGSATVGVPYTFRLQFDLTGFDAASATLAGVWGIDNFGQILLNGAAPVGTGSFSFASVAYETFNVLHSFTITGGFLPGVNTFDVQVTDGGNPGGFNVSSLSAVADVAAVPEPSTALLMSIGVLAFLAFRRARG